MTYSPADRYLQNFDIVALEKLVDWFNVMTYDLHGTWLASLVGFETSIDAENMKGLYEPLPWSTRQFSYQSHRDRSNNGSVLEK